MHLRPGVYLVGKSRDCDVVLHDEALADQHLRIWVKGGSAQVEPLADPIRVNGIRIDRNPVGVRPYRRIHAGNTVMALGEAGKPWPPELLSEPTEEGLDAAGAAWLGTGDAATQRRSRVERQFGYWVPRVAMALLILFLAAVFNNAWNGGSHQGSVSQADVRDARQVIEDTPSARHLGLRSRPDGQLEIVGFVSDAAELKALRRDLQQSGVKYIDRMLDTQELASSAETILRAVGVPYVSVEAGQPGELVMQGFVDQESNWRRALAILREDLPAGTTFNDVGVSTLAARAEALRQMIANSSLKTKLEVTINDNQLELSGELSSEETPQVRALREEFRSRFGEFPRLAENIRQTGRTRLELQIRSVSMGREPYLELKSGKRLTVGSMLDNGMRIESISTREIGLSKGDLRTTYVIGEK